MPNLIGTAPNQVPTNGSLGNMAFQNKEAVSVDTLVTTALTVTGTGALTVGGTQIVKDASGDVGIGNTPSGAKLDVSGLIRSRTSTAYIDVNHDGTNGSLLSTSSLLMYAGGANPMILHTNGTERARIDSAGNVGIGTTAPSRRLDVRGGDIQVSRAAAGVDGDAAVYFGNGGNNYIYGGSSNNLMAFAANGSERMRIDSEGDVGIGTSSPAYRLDVVSNDNSVFGYALRLRGNTASSNASTIQFTDNPVTQQLGLIYCGTGEMSFRADGDKYQSFWTNGFERMRITSSGNVGIGTSSPGNKLDVVGNAQASNLYINATAGTLGMADNSASFILYNGTGAGGITNTIRMVTNGAERMRIDGAGNVGIGTSSPDAAARLDVSSTTSGFLPPRMTTTQRDAITSPPDGLMLYNTTTNKLQVRAASAWVDLH